MNEEFVSRTEFNQLKREVEEIKKSMSESAKILQAIDKKIDVIDQKLSSSEKIDELIIEPIKKEVYEIKDSNKWLWRTVAASIIAIIINFIFSAK